MNIKEESMNVSDSHQQITCHINAISGVYAAAAAIEHCDSLSCVVCMLCAKLTHSRLITPMCLSTIFKSRCGGQTLMKSVWV